MRYFIMARKTRAVWLHKPEKLPTPHPLAEPQTVKSIEQKDISRLLKRAGYSDIHEITANPILYRNEQLSKQKVNDINWTRKHAPELLANIGAQRKQRILDYNYYKEKKDMRDRIRARNTLENERRELQHAVDTTPADLSNYTPSTTQPVVKITPGATPWSEQYEGFRRISKGRLEKAGIYQTTSGYKQLGGKPEKKQVTFNGKKVWIYESHLGVPLGYHGTTQMAELVDDRGTAEELVNKVFDGKHKTYKFTTNGGHITGMEYSAFYQLLKVSFWDGAEVIYFRVSSAVFGELYQYGINNAMRGDKHMLGIRFWDLVRIRHTLTGSRYRYAYAKEGDSRAGRTGGKVGRPENTPTSFLKDHLLYEAAKAEVAGNKAEADRLRKQAADTPADTPRWTKEERAGTINKSGSTDPHMKIVGTDLDENGQVISERYPTRSKYGNIYRRKMLEAQKAGDTEEARRYESLMNEAIKQYDSPRTFYTETSKLGNTNDVFDYPEPKEWNIDSIEEAINDGPQTALQRQHWSEVQSAWNNGGTEDDMLKIFKKFGIAGQYDVLD